MKEIIDLEGINKQSKINFYMFSLFLISSFIFGVASFYDTAFIPFEIYCGIFTLIFYIERRYWDTKLYFMIHKEVKTNDRIQRR